MALTPEEVERLETRAREVGEGIGWDLQFHVASNPEFVTVTAAPTNTNVVGPSKLTDGAAAEISDVLDRLERGELTLFLDEDGDPRLVARADAEAASYRDPGAAPSPSTGTSGDDGPLDLQRLLDIVGDAMEAVLRGNHPEVAATEIIATRQPTLRELAAAREQNQEVHSGLTPDSLRGLLPPSPVPEDVVRLRHGIDEVLVAVQRQLEAV